LYGVDKVVMQNNTNKTVARTEVLYGAENAVGRGVQFMKNSKKKMDIFFDSKAPSIVVELDAYRSGYIDIRKRGGKVRAFTEITEDNIHYCKELIKFVDELRHLDGIKGGIAVNETEYMATTVLQEAKPLTQVIYSNVKEVVEQGQYIFDIFWYRAIPAEQKIREIEEGVQPISTRILEDQDEIIKELRRLNNNSTRLSVCSAFGGMQMSYKYLFDSYVNIVDKHQKGEGKGMRWIINIDKENVNLVKVFLNAGIQVRHVKNKPPLNFGVSDKELAATIEKMEGGNISQSFLISNEPLYINHFNSFFDEIWKNGIDAKGRIKAIEEGVDSEGIEIIQDPAEIQKLGFSLIQTAIEEILVMYSTANAFHRQEYAGGIQLLKEAATERGVKVRMLTPEDELIVETARKLKVGQEEAPQPHENIVIRYIQPHLQTKVTILIVDKKYSLAIELKDDTKQTSSEAIGLATYSNSQSTVLSYASIFESLWTQTELYQKLIEADKIKDEFINVAAHELRTPIQPILGLANILRSKLRDGKQEKEYLDVIIRNAKRLQRLSEDILDITKIESKSLGLKKELFNLSEIILIAMSDSNNQIAKEIKDHGLKLQLVAHEEDIFIDADKGRINQVISNLLGNAIKFTKGGSITLAVEKKYNNREILVSIQDTGSGIHPEILPRLFTKFASKSEIGTGLGLFISKSIIEAHGGKIWGENNPDGRGATFSFSLPLEKNQ
jgi:two-component system sensor histidine kinase VicK